MQIRYIDPREALQNGIVIAIVIVYQISFIVWACQLFRLGKQKDKTQMWLVLILNLVTFYTLLPAWAIVSCCLGRNEEREEEDDEES